MARIRTIKPDFPHSESMGQVSRDARLTFIQLWTVADDSGRLRGNSRMLASLLFPYDDDAPNLINEWLIELEKQGCLIQYEVGGTHYIQITKWSEHQRIDRPSPSKFPDPPPNDSPGTREDSRGFDEEHTRPRTLSLGMEGKGIGEETSDEVSLARGRKRKKVLLEELCVDHIADWLAEKRSQGRYLRHDEHFVLEQFKQYCRSKGKKYEDFTSAYRNAFEWEKCQPQPLNGAGILTKDDRAKAAVVAGVQQYRAGLSP